MGEAIIESNTTVETVRIVLTNLAGRELVLHLPKDALVKEVKSQVKEAWGIPMREQKLLHMGQIIPSNGRLMEYGISAHDEAHIMLIRGASFHFNRALAHRHIKLGADSAEITHGGQPEYQAAFLSDVLDTEGIYTVHFKLESFREHRFKEMYVGVAPDRNRNWSNLKGAYLNHRGIYIDAFDESGWETDWFLRHSIFDEGPQQVERERLILTSEFDRRLKSLNEAWEDIALEHIDFNINGPPLVEELECMPEAVTHTQTKIEDLKEAYKNTMAEIDAKALVCEFILEIDMPNTGLRVMNVEGGCVKSLKIPQLHSDDVRLCATLGYPGQKVSIVDN